MLTPSPFRLGWLGKGSISSGACCTTTHSSWLNSRIYLSEILFSANNPFPTSPPDRFCKIGSFKGVNLVRSCRNESFALSKKALLGGLGSIYSFSFLPCPLISFKTVLYHWFIPYYVIYKCVLGSIIMRLIPIFFLLVPPPPQTYYKREIGLRTWP